MSGRIFFLGVCLLLLSSCGKLKDKSMPKDLIPKDTMKMVLKDMEIIESGLMILSNEGKDAKALVNPYYNKLLEKYHMDSVRLKSSFEYYAKNPDLLDKIYQRTLDEMMQDQSKNKYQ